MLRNLYGDGAVAVTASTGIAATHISGTTLHSWAGAGVGNGSAESLLKAVQRNTNACKQWRECKVLLIDEVSMVDANFFSKLCYIGRAVRGGAKGSGAATLPQIVVAGDFYQLPPVGLGTAGAGGDPPVRENYNPIHVVVNSRSTDGVHRAHPHQ